MRRSLNLLATLLVTVLAFAQPAAGDSKTIDGAGDIDKMSVNNKDTKVVVKIFAPVGPVHSVEARLKGTDGRFYSAVIINSPTGDANLYKGTAFRDVNCPNLSISGNADGGYWKFVVPRSCLGALTNKIKVKGYWAAVGAPGFSETAWTPKIARG